MTTSNGRRVPWPGTRLPVVPADRGMLVIVVGSSGVGKDSLLAGARRAYAHDEGIHFVRRVVTRASDDAHEPHESVKYAEFQQRQAAGDFIIDWQAHGLHYGVPSSCVMALQKNQLVIVNGSREALPRFSAVFPRRHIVHVIVPADLLKARLMARGRENCEAVERRLLRRMDPSRFDGPVWQLDNSGTLQAASNRFNQWIEAMRNATLGSDEAASS